MLAVVPMLALAVACGEDGTSDENKPGNEPGNDPGTGGGSTEKYEDIKVVNGKVRFYLSEKENSTRTITGLTARDWAKSSVIMNGKTYAVALTDDETPRPYVEVDEAASYNLSLITPNSKKWYGGSTYADIKLSHSQIYHNSAASIKAFPMYGSYSKESGNKMIFNDGFAMVMLKLKGSAKISSVKVEDPQGKVIAGFATFMPSKGYYTVNKGFDFAVLNCTNKGEFVKLTTSKNTNFRLMIAPGNYPEGLKVSICDSERGAMFVTTEPLNLSAGDVHVIEKSYACEDDLAFYEGFDNFVWGGDIMKGSEGFGFSPTADKMEIASGTELTGYEDAFALVTYDNPGSGFIQPNVWDQVSGKTVGEAHQMSESYVKSRNLADWTYAYRVQEFPGYIGSGVANNGRGMINMPQALCAKGIGDVVMKMRFALQAGFTGGIEFSIAYGGVIKAAKVNGQAVTLGSNNLQYRSETSTMTLSVGNSFLTTSSVAAGNKWNELEVTISGATSGTKLNFQNSAMSGSNLGLFVDAVEFRKVKDWKEGSNLRVLLWNVQNGVISDQHNNYDNFVKWVKKWDPDVCIWCESETIYKDKSGTGVGSGTKYLPDGWAQLCTRYGHTYAAVGGNRDNYPQTITSKYKITTVKRITDTDKSGKPVSHGAGHFQIEIHGKKINFVTLHMWPQAYSYGVSGTAAQEASAAKYEGDTYRQHEMQYIVDQTVNLPANSGEEYWILGGDTNSNSRLDDWYTKYSTSSRPSRLITHDVVLNQTNLKDVIASRDCYGEKGNVMFRSRIDILYASPKMFDCITNSIMLMDDWADTMDPWVWHTAFRDPSDHTPVLVDFKL